MHGKEQFKQRECKKNGKMLLGMLSLSASLAFGNFVSLVDHKASGGILVEKETMNVGSVVLRIDKTNPSAIYGGTWELIRGDAALRLGDGSEYNGSVDGDNQVSVPLPEHDHIFEGQELPPHSHDFSRTRIADVNDHSASNGRWLQANVTLKTSAVSAGTPVGTISKEGVSDARIDVRGAYVFVNVWKRVA